MKPPALKELAIKKLRTHLLERRFAVPKLQRNFVWDSGRAAKLLDSIYHNIPIGALFLWEMDKKSAKLIRQSGEVLPSFSDRNKDIWFVIDGQQRLSVIHQAFAAETKENDAGREIDFSRLCFVVDPEIDPDKPRPSRIVYRKPQGKEFVPLRDILAEDWRRRLPNKAQGFIKKIIDCRSRFLDYPIPVITVKSATLEEIGEVFIRVNSQGMRITSADRAIALMGEVDLRAMAEDLRRKLREQDFALATIDPILMGFNLVKEKKAIKLSLAASRGEEHAGDPPKIEAMARRWSRMIASDSAEKEKFKKAWHDYQRGFEKAVDYLRRRFCVFDESFLPSGNMLATLAVFFHFHSGNPTGQQAKEICKWFWATGVAQRYTGRNYHSNIQNDAQFFQALAFGYKKFFVFNDLLDPKLDLQSSEYASRSSRTRSFLCLLARMGPLDLENGDPIALDQSAISHANRKHRHHIFPQAQMSNHHYPARIYNSLTNVCFLISRNNTGIGMRLPRSYLKEYKMANSRLFARAMKSHLIPVSSESGVWDTDLRRGFENFRAARLKMICDAFENQAGIRLFKRR